MKLNTQGVTIWLTGLSGAGKTTIANQLAQKLQELGYLCEVLDGDRMRQQLASELGFSKHDRDENIRRIGFVANLLTRNQVFVIVAVISPYRDIRAEMRQMIGNFIEVYVNCPIEICEQRDVKGLYAKARAGLIKQFTGIDDPYEPPLMPEVECKSDRLTISECVEKILEKLIELGYVKTISA